MKTTNNKPGGWSAAREQLTTMEKPALLALLKELYEAADLNRDLIHVRCLGDECGADVLEKYRNKIVEQFFPARGFGKLKLVEARKAIRDYRKASGSIPGTAELLMTYVENGTRFTHDFGDIDERFYSSVESALDELAAMLLVEARDLYPQFQERLAKVALMAEDIGWGFGDYVDEIVGQLQDHFEDE